MKCAVSNPVTELLYIYGVDVMKGHKELTQGEWSRVIDLNDGYAKLIYKEKQDQLLSDSDRGGPQCCS